MAVVEVTLIVWLKPLSRSHCNIASRGGNGSVDRQSTGDGSVRVRVSCILTTAPGGAATCRAGVGLYLRGELAIPNTDARSQE
jgi:hypothetical protein